MKHKKIYAYLSLTFLLSGLCSCSGNTSSVIKKHECVFYPVEAVSPTCMQEGNKAYEQCPYCKKIRIDGVESTLEDTILPIDTVNGHSLTHHEGVKETCGTDGRKSYDSCSLCGKNFIDGKEADENSLVIKSSGIHSYNENNVCNDCKKAFKYSVDENLTTFDQTNQFSLSSNENGVSTSVTTNKEEMSNKMFAKPLSMTTQISSASSSKVTMDESSLVITHLSDNDTTYAFTRFAPGVTQSDGSVKQFVGRFLLSYDVTFKENAWVDRIGSQLADNTFTILKSGTQSDLL